MLNLTPTEALQVTVMVAFFMPTLSAIFAVAQQLKPYETNSYDKHEDRPTIRRRKTPIVLRQAHSIGDLRFVFPTAEQYPGK